MSSLVVRPDSRIVNSQSVNQSFNQSNEGPSKLPMQKSAADYQPVSLSASAKTRPNLEAEMSVVARTKAAIEARLSANLPNTVARVNREAQFVRYTPQSAIPSSDQTNSQKLIRVTDAPVDPFQPLLAKHKKVPLGNTEAPVPILHSPPRKLTQADAAQWRIPPCVSNWKNPRGYTIDLDKRLANDGRAMQIPTISNKFASFSESLFVAERTAREQVDMRSRAEREQRGSQQGKQEAELSRAAEEALKARHTDTRDDDRDYSEKVALGQIAPQSKQTKGGDAQFDPRLFNRSAGLSGGFGSDDAYSVYEKPLFGQSSQSKSQYRPTAGVDGTAAPTSAAARTQPVEFERDESDPFGMSSLLQTPQERPNKRRREEDE